MSIQTRTETPIPAETKRVADLAFPQGNPFMRLRNELGEIYADEQFAELFSERGQPAQSPGHLALVTVMQFAEGLSDRQAADAVRARIDWKYALGLELTDPGFNYSVLSEYRTRLIQGSQALALLDTLLNHLKQRGWLKAHGKQRTDSTHILAAVRALNRLEIVGETMRQALNEIAQVAPEWLRPITTPDWFLRYGRRFENYRLPKDKLERDRWMEQVGADGITLLIAVYQTSPTESVRSLSGVEILRQMWIQQFWTEHQPDGQMQLKIRAEEDQPPGDLRLHSPHDVEARYSIKRSTEWVGYKAHFTETCDEDSAHLITHVETTGAVVQDVQMPEKIHAALAAKDLLPGEHLLDAGFVDADLLVEAPRDLGIAICGPVPRSASWQEKAGQGFAPGNFKIDWSAKQAACPQGHLSKGWREQKTLYAKEAIVVRFPPKICRACSTRSQCTRTKSGPRLLMLRPQAQHLALQERRRFQETPEFHDQYALRSGIEGTISQAIRVGEIRQSRYIGLAKTHLEMIATAAAINVYRINDWLMEIPRALTRVSPFAALAPSPSMVSAGWRP
jgi:transposase